MVVDVDPHAFPLAVDKSRRRQGTQRRFVVPLEELAAARAIDLHHPIVEPLEQLPDALVELVEREECLVAQPRENPTLRDLHRHLDLGFVLR